MDLQQVIETYKKSCLNHGQIKEKIVEKYLSDLRNALKSKVNEIIQTRGLLGISIENVKESLMRELGKIMLDIIIAEIESECIEKQMIGIECILTLSQRISPKVCHTLGENIEEVTKKAILPLQTLILFNENGFDTILKKEIIENNFDFYTNQIDILAKHDKIRPCMLKFFDEKTQMFNDSSSKDANVFETLLQYWIGAAFIESKIPMVSQYNQLDKFRYLLRYVFHNLLFTGDVSTAFMKIFEIQHQLSLKNMENDIKEEFCHLTHHLEVDLIMNLINEIVLVSKEVNWTRLLQLMSCLSSTRNDLHKPINDLFESKLIEYVDYIETKKSPREFLIILLLARQWHLETYNKFYSAQFCQTKSIAISQKKLSNLIQILSLLVPHEPEWTMKVHKTNPFQCTGPLLCLRDAANDYYMLISTRLKDFRQDKLFTASSTARTEETDADIEKVIKLFEQKFCKELPSYVKHELIWFKKPYFHGVFLPRLLQLNQDSPQDSRKLLVEVLLKSGEIPNDLKNKFSL